MLESMVEWVVAQVEAWGYMGIFIMMFVESTFFPFPSEVAMIPAGYLAFNGKMNAYGAVLAGLLGSVGGAYFNYYFARIAGLPFLVRYGKYFFVKEHKLNRAMYAFRRHGEITTFVCRMIPVVRQLISVPAGVAGMNIARFGGYTALGAGLWVAILTGFGWFVGYTLDGDEASSMGGAWEQTRALWREHQLTIYLSLGVGLGAVVLTYVYFQRRKRAAGRDAESEVAPEALVEETRQSE